MNRNPASPDRRSSPAPAVETAAAEPLERRLLFAAADLDAAFGVGGRVTTALPGSRDDDARAVVVAGGKAVVAGDSAEVGGGLSDFALARFNANGSLDGSFGAGGAEGDGRVVTDFGGRADTVAGLAVTPAGRFVAAGTTRDAAGGADLALARYNADGSLDGSFGSGGKVTTHLGGSEGAAAVAVLPDNKVLVAGSRLAGGPDTSDLLLVRYNANGTLDSTFGGGDGWVTVDYDGLADSGVAVAVLTGGRIVVGGDVTVSGGARDLGFVRFNANGSVDGTFNGGKFVVDPVTDDANPTLNLMNWLVALIPLPGDQFTAVGRTYVPGPPDADPTEALSLIRFNAGGTFGAVRNTESGEPLHAVRLPSGKYLVSFRDVEDYSSCWRFNADFSTDAKFDHPPPVATALAALPGDAFYAATPPFSFYSGRSFHLARFTGAGALDSTFGAAGRASADFLDAPPAENLAGASAVAVGPSGKVVVAGAYNAWLEAMGGFEAKTGAALVRYNPDGSIDPSFGGTGIVLREATTLFTGVIVLRDGRVLALSQPGEVLRYTADGVLDTTFGTGGAARVGPLGRTLAAHDLLVQPDGRILVAARLSNFNAGPDAVVYRLNANGSVDTTFGGGTGRAVADFGTENDSGNAVALAPDGKIVVAGNASNDVAVARFNANGTLDATFSPGGADGSGVVRTRTEFRSAASDVAVLPSGRVVVAGIALSYTAPRRQAQLIQYNANGTLDPNFGAGGPDGNGIVATTFGAADAIGASVALAPNGRILVGGYTLGTADVFHPVDFALARFNADGTPDGTFGGGADGAVTTDFGGADELGRHGMAVAHDGSIVLAGRTGEPGGKRFKVALARYRGDVHAGAIRIDGTAGNDRITLSQSGSTLTINLNGTSGTRSLTGVTRVVVYGLDGDDTLVVNNSVAVATTLLGGRGNDSLRGGSGGADDLFGGDGTDAADYSAVAGGVSVALDERANDGPGGRDNVHTDTEIVLGGSGNDTLTGSVWSNVLVGNGGTDTLRGGGGRDVLIGGNGPDSLFGDAGEDLLINGRTSYDANLPLLRALSAEWRSTARTYSQRVSRLLAGASGVRIHAGSVFNDSAVDKLTGGADRDWFVYHAGDSLLDRKADETATKI